MGDASLPLSGTDWWVGDVIWWGDCAIQALGIRTALTPSRNNGLMNMLKVIQDDIRQQLQESPPPPAAKTNPSPLISSYSEEVGSSSTERFSEIGGEGHL